MATSGEYLRIWEVGEESRVVKLKSKLSNVRVALSHYYVSKLSTVLP